MVAETGRLSLFVNSFYAITLEGKHCDCGTLIVHGDKNPNYTFNNNFSNQKYTLSMGFKVDNRTRKGTGTPELKHLESFTICTWTS